MMLDETTTVGEDQETPESVYEPPALVEVGTFTELTMGWGYERPDRFRAFGL